MRSRVGVIVLIASGLLLTAPGAALAHAGFVSSSPEPGSELGTAPGVVVLRFSEPLNADLSRSSVTTPDGQHVAGRVTGQEEITVDLFTNVRGIYDVSWTTVSLVDGHTLTGSFAFGVGVPVGAGGAGVTGSSPRPTDLMIAALRVMEDVGLLLAIGMLLLGRLSRTDPPLRWVRSRPTVPLAVAFASGLGVILGEALAASGRASAGPIVSYLTTGIPGVARLAQPSLELAALGMARRRPQRAAIPVAAAVVALSAAGHAAAISPRWWGVAVESLHFAAAGLWAGGIVALAFQRPPDGWRGTDGRALLDRFTPVALFAFATTITAGVVRGVQEVGSFHELFGSSYGGILLVKVLLVLVMALLSVFAWRRTSIRPRVEAAVVIGVVGTAALLAAYPLPPARFAQADAQEAAPRTASALPEAGDVTLGGHAGEFLVGLTVRGDTRALAIYLHGLRSNEEAAAAPVTVTVGGQPAPVQECGPTCRDVPEAVRSGDEVIVTVGGSGGGSARFQVPDLSAPSGDELLARMTSAMQALSTYRIDETLSSGLATVRATYGFKAPDSFESHVVEPDGGGSKTVWTGDTRFLQQEPGGNWQVDTGASPTVPSFTWDSFRPFIDARVVGTARPEGVDTDVVTFFGESYGTPIWFRLWIDDTGLVLKSEMRALGHFMDDRYFAFDDPLSIEPPAGVSVAGREPVDSTGRS